ncbi:hypothetical protein [Cellulomonas aerilata]|uniref:DUF8129 domain-containing protein n=1 Tax=Cellulomonas aerilata TaxID=515326 RepID=A0A512DB94_9CELL|nr:hypothetical protein [Cellulomonas aerilata]GEO33759.1 hypothetical protein CAE01nite_14840 [Cellulomonas aerilata]
MADQVSREDLPIPDYDHLPIGDLGHRIRSLGADQLSTLLAHEQAHGNRLPVTQLIETRLADVQGGAPLSGGDPAGLSPALADTVQGGSQVSTATQGPVINPPSHGDPTNPAQPR